MSYYLLSYLDLQTKAKHRSLSSVRRQTTRIKILSKVLLLCQCCGSIVLKQIAVAELSDRSAEIVREVEGGVKTNTTSLRRAIVGFML